MYRRKGSLHSVWSAAKVKEEVGAELTEEICASEYFCPDSTGYHFTDMSQGANAWIAFSGSVYLETEPECDDGEEDKTADSRHESEERESFREL